MIQSLLIGISLVASFFGLLKTPISHLDYDWQHPPFNLGSTNFPTSADSLTNPASTDSVATVSHSSQHSNANDAIEAIEAKLGIGASTPVANTIFAGIATGQSGYTTYATTTSLVSTNILANGSSTLQNFTFVNATGTRATTTNFYSTTASSTDLYSTTFRGGGLSACTGTSFLQWNGGSFVCGTPTVATGINTFSTTSVQNLATTTIRSSEMPSGSYCELNLDAPNLVGEATATTTSDIYMAFNWNTDSTHNSYSWDHLSNTTNTFDGDEFIFGFRIVRQGNGSDGRYRLKHSNVKFSNLATVPKMGSMNGSTMASTTAFIDTNPSTNVRAGNFIWATSTLVSTIDIWPSVSGANFATSTKISVMCY